MNIVSTQTSSLFYTRGLLYLLYSSEVTDLSIIFTYQNKFKKYIDVYIIHVFNISFN